MKTLRDLIGQIESENNYGAIRFEPNVYFRSLEGGYQRAFARARSANRCSAATANMIVATSWGRFQLMGFTLYDTLDYKGTVGAFFSCEQLQDELFASFVTARQISFTLPELAEDYTKRERLARLYNGSVRYVEKIEATLAKFGYVVKTPLGAINADV